MRDEMKYPKIEDKIEIDKTIFGWHLLLLLLLERRMSINVLNDVAIFDKRAVRIFMCCEFLIQLI